MNEVRSTNELACRKVDELEVRQTIVLLQMKSKRQKQASLMGYAMHTLHGAYEAAID